MIEITTIDRALVGQFDNFNDLFEAITNIENSTSKNSEFSQMNWRFMIHPPQRER
jgi:hypothetical protein